MRLSSPAPNRKVTSPYGPRRHPITGERGRMHHGVDFGGVFPVLTAADGVVRHIGYNARGGGHVVGIEHGTNLWTFYYHGATRTALRQGQRVTAGDFIYTSGNTGASNGNHLHFEVRRSRRWGDTVDPMPLLTTGTPQVILPVNGRPSRETWRVWQDDLKKHGYTGRLDGIPGPLTYSAIQRYSGAPVTSRLDTETRKAVQKKIRVLPDGIWGRITWSEIQRRLNTGKM